MPSTPSKLLASERLRIGQAADYLGVSAPTLKRWRGAHYGPKSVKVGGTVWYFRADLEEWLLAQRGYGDGNRGLTA